MKKSIIIAALSLAVIVEGSIIHSNNRIIKVMADDHAERHFRQEQQDTWQRNADAECATSVGKGWRAMGVDEQTPFGIACHLGNEIAKKNSGEDARQQ